MNASLRHLCYLARYSYKTYLVDSDAVLNTALSHCMQLTSDLPFEEGPDDNLTNGASKQFTGGSPVALTTYTL